MPSKYTSDDLQRMAQHVNREIAKGDPDGKASDLMLNIAIYMPGMTIEDVRNNIDQLAAGTHPEQQVS